MQKTNMVLEKFIGAYQFAIRKNENEGQQEFTVKELGLSANDFTRYGISPTRVEKYDFDEKTFNKLFEVKNTGVEETFQFVELENGLFKKVATSNNKIIYVAKNNGMKYTNKPQRSRNIYSIDAIKLFMKSVIESYQEQNRNNVSDVYWQSDEITTKLKRTKTTNHLISRIRM